MIVLGLDISSVCVGYAVFNDTQLIEAGRYHQVGDHHGERLAAFLEWLDTTFGTFKPDNVVIELPYPVARKNTYGVLMMYVGAVMAAHFSFYRKEVPEGNLIPAALVKLTLKVPKQDTYEDRKRVMVELINSLYNLELVYNATDRTKRISEDDVADAIALVRTWLIRQEAKNERGSDSKQNRSRRRSSKVKASR